MAYVKEKRRCFSCWGAGTVRVYKLISCHQSYGCYPNTTSWPGISWCQCDYCIPRYETCKSCDGSGYMDTWIYKQEIQFPPPSPKVEKSSDFNKKRFAGLIRHDV